MSNANRHEVQENWFPIESLSLGWGTGRGDKLEKETLGHWERGKVPATEAVLRAGRKLVVVVEVRRHW